MRGLRYAVFFAINGVILGAGCDDGRAPRVDVGQGQACVSKDTFKIDRGRKLDLLFVVDDSPAMAAMDAKLAAAYPLLGSSFVPPRGGTPFNLHVAVVSASLGPSRT